ncbi:hypothetical protein MF1_12170 [Bartonella quintana]|nr:hypothetical protein RM11_1167 [Bartonella quintana RM-11]BBL53959.1 hypothetical protein MF1_12170 [Bartonella quintana]
MRISFWDARKRAENLPCRFVKGVHSILKTGGKKEKFFFLRQVTKHSSIMNPGVKKRADIRFGEKFVKDYELWIMMVNL